MKIQSTPTFNLATRSLPQAAVQTNNVPQDKVNLQGEGNQPNQPDPQKPGHFSGSSLLTRVAGGALNGLVCNYFSGGSVMGAALVGGGVGAIYGGATGVVIGAKYGNRAAGETGAVAGALVAGGVGTMYGGLAGAVKGAVTIALCNSIGGGALAAAGVGAAISLIF